MQSIDGKGAFRRFKDVLMAFPVDRERWFTFRSERLRTCMEGWLDAQGVEAVERPEWDVPTADDVRPQVETVERWFRAARRARRRARALPRVSAASDASSSSCCQRASSSSLSFLEFLRDRRPCARTATRDAHDFDGRRRATTTAVLDEERDGEGLRGR